MPRFLICISLAVMAAVVAAQTPSPPTSTSLPAQSTAIQDVPVPVPRQIFFTLDKFAHSNWRAVQRPELARWKTHGDQTEIALLLGAVIAEGFIAVEAEDTGEVKSLGHEVLALARGLGVERAALRRSRAIVEHAEKGDWPAVRKEWDGVQPDVEHGMKELKSERLAQLVSLAGWLRGTQALSALILQNYSEENATLLLQPALLDHFESQLNEMPADTRSKPNIARMREGIRKVRALLPAGEKAISKEVVQEIANITEELLIGFGPKAKKG
jgi:hypothetical protein